MLRRYTRERRERRAVSHEARSQRHAAIMLRLAQSLGITAHTSEQLSVRRRQQPWLDAARDTEPPRRAHLHGQRGMRQKTPMHLVQRLMQRRRKLAQLRHQHRRGVQRHAQRRLARHWLRRRRRRPHREDVRAQVRGSALLRRLRESRPMWIEEAAHQLGAVRQARRDLLHEVRIDDVQVLLEPRAAVPRQQRIVQAEHLCACFLRRRATQVAIQEVQLLRDRIHGLDDGVLALVRRRRGRCLAQQHGGETRERCSGMGVHAVDGLDDEREPRFDLRAGCGRERLETRGAAAHDGAGLIRQAALEHFEHVFEHRRWRRQARQQAQRIEPHHDGVRRGADQAQTQRNRRAL